MFFWHAAYVVDNNNEEVNLSHPSYFSTVPMSPNPPNFGIQSMGISHALPIYRLPHIHLYLYYLSFYLIYLFLSIYTISYYRLLVNPFIELFSSSLLWVLLSLFQHHRGDVSFYLFICQSSRWRTLSVQVLSFSYPFLLLSLYSPYPFLLSYYLFLFIYNIT